MTGGVCSIVRVEGMTMPWKMRDDPPQLSTEREGRHLVLGGTQC